MEDRAFWPALQKIEGLGSTTIRALWQELGGVRNVWEAKAAELVRLKWLDETKRRLLLEKRQEINPQTEWNKVFNLGLKLVMLDEADYPQPLKNIDNPPLGLYVLGNLPEKDTAIAIVGSRRPTPYGRRVAESIAEELALDGITIVSGMARGIDTCAHQGALKAAEGQTIAVLGCGLDIVYPPENKGLFAQICQRGAVISEFPPGTPPDKKNFPQRNRIISGLSWGTIVVEAAEKSGSLITADLAAEQGREVFAVPGPITSPLSRGTNRLLKQGASLVQSASDILDEFSLQPLFKPEPQSNLALSGEERVVWENLSWEPASIDALLESTGLTAAKLNSALTFLELKGLIGQLPGRHFVRR